MTRKALAAATIALPLILGFGAGAARAAEDCSDLANQAEMNACYARQLKVADTALNSVYNKLMGKLGDKAKARLREAEQAWIAYRDKECAFETMGTEGGSIHNAMLAACLRRITDAHTKELKDQADCQEGDVSCTQ